MRHQGNYALDHLKMLTKRPIGQILLDAGLITPDDLNKALVEQAESNVQLGQILVNNGAIDQTILNAVLAIQNDLAQLESALKTTAGEPERLGELLIQTGRVTRADVESALAEQQKTREKIGEILVRRGLFTEDEINAALAFQSYQAGPDNVTKLRLGEILVAAGYITRVQLDESLEAQSGTDKRIGEVLVEAGYVKPHHIEHALKIQRKLVIAALAASLALSSVGTASYAGETYAQAHGAKVFVSAVIKARAELKLLYQSQELLITNADAMRGWVEVKAATLLEVRNNSRSGYVVSFNGLNGPFREVIVGGLQNEVQISMDNGWAAQQYTGTKPEVRELNYRFKLSNDVRPGTNAWPISISVHPS